MKYLLNKKTETVYFCLYLSLILGLFLNEDFAFGSVRDYLLHTKILHIFENKVVKKSKCSDVTFQRIFARRAIVFAKYRQGQG